MEHLTQIEAICPNCNTEMIVEVPEGYEITSISSNKQLNETAIHAIKYGISFTEGKLSGLRDWHMSTYDFSIRSRVKSVLEKYNQQRYDLEFKLQVLNEELNKELELLNKYSAK